MGILKANAEIEILPEGQRSRYIQLFFQELKTLINGSIDFSKNINLPYVDVVFTEANVNKSVNHDLKRVPRGVFVIKKNAAMIVYDGTGVIDGSVYSLRSSATGTARIVFL